MQEQLKRIDSRLARMEQLLKTALAQIPPTQSARITEKKAVEEFEVSKVVLRRLRLGYTRNDGVEIPPLLFNWGHRQGRNFDYDRRELEEVLRRKSVTE